MKEAVEINTGTIKITYENYGDEGRNYGELFDLLGGFDIVTASEIKENFIAYDGDIYIFSHRDEQRLADDGSVTIYIYGSVEDYKESDKEFYNWYYNL